LITLINQLVKGEGMEEETLDELIRMKEAGVRAKYGATFASDHELYAVLLQELDEFWESVKANETDSLELVDLIVMARLGILWMNGAF
jgi:hypothetical protein